MEWKERLSQRRGQGLMILDPYQLEVNHAADSALQQLPASGCAVTGSGNTERLQDEIDGAVTVEELKRDEPLESSSTTTSPSSKFRFSLPGCSPRPPHSSLFHGSIFSFPSYSYGRRRWRRERRFFYPWIFPRASYRLPAVAEKPHPVGDPVIQIEQEQIAVFINKDPAGRQQSLFEEPSGLTADSSLSSDPAALLCPLEGSSASCQLDQVDAGLIGDVPIGQLGGQCISRVAAAGEQRNEDLICALRNQDHQWSTGGGGVLPDENRTAHQQQKQHVSGCCCCGAKRNVSFSCFIRGLETLRSEAQGVIGSRSGGAVPLHLQLLSTSIISEVTCSCANPKAPIPADEESEDADVKDRPIIPPQDYSFIMDSGRQVVTPPLSAGTNQVGATTKSIDGYGMQADAAQQSPVVMSSCSTAPLTIFSSALHSSCHQHQLGSRMASSNCPAQGIINVKNPGTTTPSPSGILINSSQASSSSGSSYCSDGNPPDRPARRSRSPKELNETAAGRDRRAFSADRPIVLTAVVNIPTTTSGTISAASRAKTRSAGPTKVERLRQLTQRLRPSSLSSVPPAFIEPVVVQTEQQKPHTNCNHLPPLPVAPPRHPDRRGAARSDRKISTASKSVKRDSATSTTDLGVSPLSSSSISASVLDAADGVPPAPTESGGAKNSDIVRKKTAAPAGSSAEVTRPSLFWSSPPPSAAAAAQTSPPFANNTTAAAAGQRVGSGLFSTQLPFDSSSDRRSGGRTPSASIGGSGCDDIFDDDFQEHLKLNPRILVGTYTQRTIPFRSASFSQIDHVGNNADGVGTYSRRPRTSITLKPVTYSIGRTETTSPQSSTTCSLPRKLKISPDAAVTSPGIQPPPTPDSSHSKLLWKNPSSSSEEFDPDPTETIGLSSAASPLVVSNDTSGNEDVLITLPKMEESSTTTETNSDTSSQIKTVDYETTEISVTAEIPWVPHNPKNPSEEPINPPEDPVESLEDLNTSSSLKALPVLDLLELNNHLLRLKAACCSSRESGGSISALDQLADLEVAAQFSDTPSGVTQKTSSDPVSGSETERRPSWLTEILRLTNGESNSSLSDEGCVPDAHNPSDKTSEPLDHPSAPIIEHQHPVETCAPSIMAPSNKPSPQLERNHSVKTRQRRRSSSLVLAGSSLTLTADSGLCTKSNSARSLTFLTPPSSKSETGEPSFISSSSEQQQQQQEVAPPLASGQLATDDSISTETYVVDAFKPVGQDGASPTEKAVLTKDDNCDASVGQLLVMNSNHRTSAGSDEQDDEELLKANKDTTTSHRLTVSVNLTLADDNQAAVSSTPASSAVTTPYRQNTPSPFSPDQLLIDSNSCGVQQKSPLTPRRYGLKRRPLRGPYGEMLEAEMNKSEFGKMYSSTSTNAGVKRNTTAEDLTFLREPNLRIITNREAKSSSPRPLISPSSSIIPDGEGAPISAISPSINYSVRQNSLPLPTSHSLDDSQLKVGYNTLPSTLPSSATVSPTRLVIPPKRKISANLPYVFSDGDLELSNQQQSRSSTAGTNRTFSLQPSSAHQVKQQLSVLGNAAVTPSSSNHQRTSSSPCQLIQFTTETGFTSEDEPELLELTTLSSALSRSTARLLDSSTTAHQDPVLGAEQRHTLPLPRVGSAKRQRDTRTHAIGELYDTERSYVESLQILVTKYLQPLKSPECSGLVESTLVDEIFYQIPAILAHHEVFLEELRKRLESWDSKQCVGGVFLETLTKPSVIETYTAYINHWKHAKEAVKSACSAKSAFSKFLETMAREHKGKLALDSLLIMPVQRIPRYELLIKMLLKHTARDHPDHGLLLEAQREVHELAVKINCVEREAYGVEQQQATLRELESLVEGLGPGNLASPERIFIRHDCVTIPSALGTRKERGLFLFSDLLVITSVKRRGAAMRKSSSYSSSGIASTLEANKFKLLMRVPLDDLEMTKGKDEGSKRSTKDLEHLEEDLAILSQMIDMVSSLHVSHGNLDEAIKDVQHGIQRQLSEKQNSFDAPQLATIDLAISTQEGTETLSVAFNSAEKRASWEESFIETKLKLRAMSPDRRPPPEFLSPLPIRKTRAGLQFTCAAPTVVWNSKHLRDVWVCNSDGYVGQVCILSLHPEPNVVSCNGVCNARITCIAAVPAAPTSSEECNMKLSESKMEASPDRIPVTMSGKPTVLRNNFELESSESSSDSSDGEESPDEESIGPVNFNRSRADSIPVDIPLAEEGSSDTGTGQATMWLGTEDGCIHIYHCGENIRLKKNRIRIQQGAAVLSIVYVENRVFASLANGDIVVYFRDPTNGTWNINDPQCVTIGSIVTPVTRMLSINNSLWCASQNTVKILNVNSLCVQDQFAVSSDSQRSVLCMSSNGLGVWVAMQGSAVIRLFHGLTHECICDVNLAPAVNKMLSGCDDIIRQHKAACLRVTSMLVCHDLVWVGTSAGVILTIPTPHLTPISSRLSTPPVVTGIPHGHTGHVRFLTCVEATPEVSRSSRSHHLLTAHHRFSVKGKDIISSSSTSSPAQSSSVISSNRFYVISGGDGYEDFRHTGFADSVGREDSTNHLLMWQV